MYLLLGNYRYISLKYSVYIFYLHRLRLFEWLQSCSPPSSGWLEASFLNDYRIPLLRPMNIISRDLEREGKEREREKEIEKGGSEEIRRDPYTDI